MQKSEIKFKITTPDKIIVDGYYSSVIFPGESGNFELLANHENFISQLKVGTIHAKAKDHTTSEFVVSASFAKFSHHQNICEVAAEYAMSLLEAQKLSKDVIASKTEAASCESQRQFYQYVLTMIHS